MTKSLSKTQTQTVAPVAPATAPAKTKAPPQPPPPPQGLYKDLGVVDETKDFGALAMGARDEKTRGVVLHRTESSSAEGARDAYRSRVKAGQHVGAHYLVDTDGTTSLTVPTDKNVAHVRGNQDKDWKGANAWSVGIETVGPSTKLDRNGDLRKQVQGLTLSPALKQRLLAMDDKTLKATLADGGYEIDTDINGPQKRANYNLVNKLRTDNDLGLDRVQPHEAVDYKTLGEGEPIKEMLTAMDRYPGRIDELAKKVAALKAQPGADPKQVQALEALLAKEQGTLAAVRADKTPAETNALAAEDVLEQKDGPAHQRETDRTDFWANFWDRQGGLDKALAPPAAAAAGAGAAAKP